MKSFSLKNTKLGKTLGKKGLYISLGACLLALAGAGVAAYNKTMDSINETLSIADSAITAAPAENKVTDVPKTTAKTESSSSAKDKTGSSSKDSKNDLDIKTQPDIMPVKGDIITPFSNGELVKSETLGVWKTHDGVDIKADAGTAVKAMNKGVVIKVWNDALWGSCVKIDHGSGVIGHYYGLAANAQVSEGDRVNSGDTIGSVGDTAQIEVSLPSHLHFALERNQRWIDPIEFISPSTK